MPAQPTDRPSHITSITASALALVLCGALAGGGWLAITQVRQLPGVVLPVPRPVAPLAPTRITPHPTAAEETGPGWASLSAAQQHALEPLQPHWSTLTEAQKHKWISLAGKFHKLSAANQAKVHERMTAWAALTPQQRNRARLNFAETQRITAPAKQEQWDAYQALSEEARQALAARAAAQPQGAAMDVRPAASHKFVHVPAADGSGIVTTPNPPKILPPVVDMVPVPVPVPVPAAGSTPPAEVPASSATSPATVQTEPITMPSAPATALPPLSTEPVAPPASGENSASASTPAPAPISAVPSAVPPPSPATPTATATPDTRVKDNPASAQ